jgi:hypothetical protein
VRSVFSDEKKLWARRQARSSPKHVEAARRYAMAVARELSRNNHRTPSLGVTSQSSMSRAS